MTSKNAILEEAFKNIEKQFGKWAVMRMGDASSVTLVNTISSGSYVLDTILWGGYPEGRVVEIYGPESSGKTTISLHAIAEVQKSGGICAFIDAEHSFDPTYAKKLGVDVDNLIVSQPDYGEQALQIAEELAKTGQVKMIVIDSVAALVPKAEVEGDMGDSHMGLQARMMSQGLRKLSSVLSKSGTICFFINQIRMKIGVMFGNPETTSGGNALKFFASQRLEIRKGDKIMSDKDQIGYFAKIKIVKNKIAVPFKNAEIPVLWDQGIAHLADIVEAITVLKIVEKGGAFYSIGDKKIQGKEKVIELLKSDPALTESFEKQIKERLKAMRLGEKILDDNAFTGPREEEEELDVELDLEEEEV